MENPNTWTPLHHAIHRAHTGDYSNHHPDVQYEKKVEALQTILQAYGIECSWNDVNCVLTQFNYNCLSHFCGCSFPVMLVNRLKK